MLYSVVQVMSEYQVIFRCDDKQSKERRSVAVDSDGAYDETRHVMWT